MRITVAPSATTSNIEIPSHSNHACLSCRQLHRKCDKTLPACSYCIKRGYKCVYKERSEKLTEEKKASHPIVFVNVHSTTCQSQEQRSSRSCTTPTFDIKGSHASSSISTPYSNATTIATTANSISPVESRMEHQINYVYTTRQTMDLYYDILSMGFPLVDRKTFDKVLEYQTSSRSGQIMTNDYRYDVICDLEKDQALLYTVQAVCFQRLGCRELASFHFSNGKQLIGKYFDDVDSISIILGMRFMAEYLLGVGEKRKARSLLNTVKVKVNPFIQQLQQTVKESHQDQTRTDYIEKLMMSGQANWLIVYLLESEIRFFDFFYCEIENPESFILDELGIFTKNQMTISKQNLGISSCKSLNREAAEKLLSIIEAFNCIVRLAMDNFGKKDVLSVLLTEFVMSQLRLDILTNCDQETQDLQEILRVSRHVIQLTEHRHFPFIPASVTKAVITACTIRATYYSYLTPEDNLRNDLRALKILSARYPLIQNEYSHLIKSIESLTYLQHNSEDMMLLANLLPFSEVETRVNCGWSDQSVVHRCIGASSIEEKNMHFNQYERHKSTLRELMSGSEILDIVVESIKEEVAIKTTITDPEQQMDSLKNMRLRLGSQVIELAKHNNDYSGQIAGELLKKQALFEFNLSKARLENPEFDLTDELKNDFVYRFFISRSRECSC
ncbi:hypothetical protein C9374_007666 [Naegleria lovaniensis]|uniref:Zn(2)-C6 fungal-type domain-containing protein n=1 Tax=Naegleria lovaniensis TaxID=51637 RepID=A0AA88GMK0_NAELO|nr:uncharacterized protein C9374_007666 [Naegleria lovaniensis]KAG2379028.1 hypothetical protein C9374_007666 [Naegleria lovaniensis]